MHQLSAYAMKVRSEGGGRQPSPRAWSEPEGRLLGQYTTMYVLATIYQLARLHQWFLASSSIRLDRLLVLGRVMGFFGMCQRFLCMFQRFLRMLEGLFCVGIGTSLNGFL